MNVQEKYPDLRYKYMRGLIQKERYQRKKNYLKNAAEWTAKAIVSLDLSQNPVRSVKQASKLEGVGNELGKELRTIEASGIISDELPRDGQFCTSAAAILVTMGKIKNERAELKTNASGLGLIEESTIKRQASEICEETFQVISDDKNVGFCPAWWRMAILCSRGLVKKRSLNKQTVYELLPEGEEIANRLLCNPAVRNRLNKSRQPDTVLQRVPAHDYLYTTDTGSDGVVLLIDSSEGGGDRVGLGELTRLIDRAGMRHRTQRLACGDYQWLWRFNNTERILPVLIERKRADDLASSLRDGRYVRQKTNMIQWKNKYVACGTYAVLKYLVEGRPEDYVVQCVDGCGSLIRCGYPTVPQVQAVIDELDDSEDFELIRTDDIRATVDLLAAITADLLSRVQQGDFVNLLAHDPNDLTGGINNHHDNASSNENQGKQLKKAGLVQNSDNRYDEYGFNLPVSNYKSEKLPQNYVRNSEAAVDLGVISNGGGKSIFNNPQISRYRRKVDLSTVSLTQHHRPRVSQPKRNMPISPGARSRNDIDQIIASGEIPMFGSSNLRSTSGDEVKCFTSVSDELPVFLSKNQMEKVVGKPGSYSHPTSTIVIPYVEDSGRSTFEANNSQKFVDNTKSGYSFDMDRFDDKHWSRRHNIATSNSALREQCPWLDSGLKPPETRALNPDSRSSKIYSENCSLADWKKRQSVSADMPSKAMNRKPSLMNIFSHNEALSNFISVDEIDTEISSTKTPRSIAKQRKPKRALAGQAKQNTDSLEEYDMGLDSDIPDLLSPPKRNRKSLNSKQKSMRKFNNSSMNTQKSQSSDFIAVIDSDDSNGLPEIDINMNLHPGADYSYNPDMFTTLPNVKSSEKNIFTHEIQQVKSILSNASSEAIKLALEENNGNIEAAVCCLLDGD